MVLATVGSELAAGLGMQPAAAAADAPDTLRFGPMEPLVCLMQETPADRLLPALVERLQSGTDLKQLVAAAALANARTFGGEDYIGFHTLMALPPAYHMARELPAERQALPVLKVLFRNSSRIQESSLAQRHPAAGRAGHPAARSGRRRGVARQRPVEPDGRRRTDLCGVVPEFGGGRVQ